MTERLNDDTQIKAFWDKTEAELGEAVIVCTVGRALSGWVKDVSRKELWGLFFLTERALYFRHFRKQHWLSAAAAGSGLQTEDRELYAAIPFDRMQTVTLQRHGSILKRLFFGNPAEFCIEYAEADGSWHTVRFALDAKADTFLNVIETCRA